MPDRSQVRSVFVRQRAACSPSRKKLWSLSREEKVMSHNKGAAESPYLHHERSHESVAGV
jgi:hypothetical protein